MSEDKDQLINATKTQTETKQTLSKSVQGNITGEDEVEQPEKSFDDYYDELLKNAGGFGKF